MPVVSIRHQNVSQDTIYFNVLCCASAPGCDAIVLLFFFFLLHSSPPSVRVERSSASHHYPLIYLFYLMHNNGATCPVPVF